MSLVLSNSQQCFLFISKQKTELITKLDIRSYHTEDPPSFKSCKNKGYKHGKPRAKNETQILFSVETKVVLKSERVSVLKQAKH